MTIQTQSNRGIPKEIIQSVLNAKSIWIFMHIAPDGDTMGSAFALAHSLESIGKSVLVIGQDAPPQDYDFMLEDVSWVAPEKVTGQAEVAIAVDVADLSRIDRARPLFLSTGIQINIDHHVSNEQYAKYNYVAIASSTVELVLDVIDALGVTLDEWAAKWLYIGLVADTGQFGYSSTTSHTHVMAARLLKAGVNPAPIIDQLYHRVTLEKIRLIGAAIERLELYGEIGIITLSQEEIRAAGAQESDCDGIVEMIRNIRQVEVAVLLRQKGGKACKASLRAKHWMDVEKIATQFGGGGHIRASGCTITEELPAAKKRILAAVQQAMEKEGMV